MTDLLSRAAALLVGLLAVSAALIGCSPTPIDAAAKQSRPTSSPAPGDTQRAAVLSQPTAPDVDTCRALAFAAVDRYANDTATTSCERPHTAYTFAVTRLPADVAFEGVAIRNAAVQQAAAASCRKEFASYAGGDAATRALVRLDTTYFLPDQRSFDRGARWVRCDIIALRTDAALGELPVKLAGALDDPEVVDKYAVCSVAEPGAPSPQLVTCDQQHAYRAIASVRLGAPNARYPGDTVTGLDGRRRCEEIVDAWADDQGRDRYAFSWTYPTFSDWQTGQRFGYCWSRTPD